MFILGAQMKCFYMGAATLKSVKTVTLSLELLGGVW